MTSGERVRDRDLLSSYIGRELVTITLPDKSPV